MNQQVYQAAWGDETDEDFGIHPLARLLGPVQKGLSRVNVGLRIAQRIVLWEDRSARAAQRRAAPYRALVRRLLRGSCLPAHASFATDAWRGCLHLRDLWMGVLTVCARALAWQSLHSSCASRCSRSPSSSSSLVVC